MTHALLLCPPPADPRAVDRAVGALSRFKQVSITDACTTAVGHLSVAPARRAATRSIARSADAQVLIADLGTWLPLPAERGRDAAWLIETYLEAGAMGLARRLQGFFALLIVDLRTRQCHVITDRCGSLHVFHRPFDGGHAVCTSSAALAAIAPGQLDAVGVHEFIATGVIYEARTLWADVNKLPPASVATFADGRLNVQPYWHFGEVRAQTLNLDEAVDATYQSLVAVLKALPECSQPIVSDLTGGYDSRFLLAGLLASGRRFETTVSGPADHADVRVAAAVAAACGVKHQHVPPNPTPSNETFAAALRMTDGEYDAFDYARILDTHHGLSANHGMSLNGSFGELARGYWWELLWPRLGQRRPLDTDMIAARRFAALPYDPSVFSTTARLDLRAELAAVAARALQLLTGFANTTQMDCVYYTLRMQRWQGRIASSTHQLWPAFSPIAFAQVLDPILAAKAETRFRSLLVRRLFARHAPKLAGLPLEHGYPPTPATLTNLWRFLPVLEHYGGKVYGKIRTRLGGTPAMAGAPPLRLCDRPEVRAVFPDLARAPALPMPHLAATGLFDEAALAAFIDPSRALTGHRLDQWRRLITLECLLARLGEAA